MTNSNGLDRTDNQIFLQQNGFIREQKSNVLDMHSNAKPGRPVHRNKGGEDLSFMNLEGAAINKDSEAGNGSFKV